MEAGILALLFLFGSYVISTDENESVENEAKQIVTQEKQENKQESKTTLSIINSGDYSNQRFFKNNYQLEITQYHFEGNLRIRDSYSTMTLSSADIQAIADSYQDYDKDNNPYNVFFDFSTQMIPNDTETRFDMKYRINYKEDYSLNQKNKSVFEIDLQNRIDMYLDKTIEINHKNYQYELTLRKNKESKSFKNAEIMDCDDDFTCEILKENTLIFKSKKTLPNKEIKVPKATLPQKDKDLKNKFKAVKKEPDLITFNNYIIYNVKKGDTLSGIGARHNIPVLLIMKLNNLKSSNLKINDELLIANKSTKIHTISKDENLFKLSSKYNVNIDELLKNNNLKDPNTIYEGYQLIISL